MDDGLQEGFFFILKAMMIGERKGRELDPRAYNVADEREFRAVDSKECKSCPESRAAIVVHLYLRTKTFDGSLTEPHASFTRTRVVVEQTFELTATL